MTSYNIYPTAPENPQVGYHLVTIQNKQQELTKLNEGYKKKYKKYTKTLNRLVALNACTSRLSAATGISSVVTLSTFIDLPVSIPLSAVSLAGTSVSGVTTALTKKYQKKLLKVTKLVDIVMSAIAASETCLSKVLRNDNIDEEEFITFQKFYLKKLNELSDIDLKMEAENRNQFEKSLLEEINDIKKTLGTRV